jgi:hypothetical protein
MQEQQTEEYLGPDHNDSGYFSQANRFVYYWGNERTIIDSERLLIVFENDVVHEYSMRAEQFLPVCQAILPVLVHFAVETDRTPKNRHKR